MFIDIFKLVLIILIVLLIFGAKKIPGLASAWRKSGAEMRKEMSEIPHPSGKEEPENKTADSRVRLEDRQK